MEVLRLQNDKNTQHDLQNTLQHWDKSSMYDEKQINAIESSNAKSFHQPTSIPSPFARIALVKTAFSEVAEYNYNSLTAYQKIVSDTLDVAEIFFTYDKWRQKIEIIKWDRKDDLEKLFKGHRQLYHTLDMFLKNDAENYNFDKMESIYILKYKDTGDMIGATSPSTMFFSSANEFKNIIIELSSSRKAFDGIVPLHVRSWEFQKYLYTWIAANNENKFKDGKAASSVFHELAKYLEMQKPLINRTAEIDDLTRNASRELISTYKELTNSVEVLGKPLYQSKTTVIDNLTVNDLLEDTIIRLPYEINKESFFNGNLEENSKQTYLLPIKKNFFKYFTIEELKQAIKINHTSTVAEVEMKIGNQHFQKKYKITDGSLIQTTFDCAIFPKIKFKNEKEAHYRFGLVYDFKEKDNYSAEYVNIDKKNDELKTRQSIRNESRQYNYQLKNYSLEGSNFDYIQIKYKEAIGIIIPKLEAKTGDDVFVFAVDFGTTNTHIEYKIESEKEIRSFDISKTPVDDRQIHWLHGGEDYFKEVFDEEYIPEYTDEEFRLPMRTALSYGENTNWQDVYPFEKASFDELYEKRLSYPYNKIITDLKWSDNDNNQKQVKVYIESIMYVLRNKVVLNNGNLTKTKIRWFYPISMERARFKNLESAWNDAYQNYFGGDKENIIAITESVAPFEYYIRAGTSSNLVSIDIGGGTTDIVISSTGKVDYITSFRFAANSIFGNGFSEIDIKKNGIVRQFFEEIKSELQSSIDKNDKLFGLFNYMDNNKSSADIASFLFSLKHNKTVKTAGENLANNVNLESKLTIDTTQKISFVFFYAAIIYHLAKLMKAKDLEMPDKIVFSGNGSRVIPLFTDDSEILEGFTKEIFKKVYNEKTYLNSLNITLNKDNPKEATCKGGFYIKSTNTFGEILKKQVVLHSNGTNSLIERKNSGIGDTEKKNTYNTINEEYLSKSVEEVSDFIDIVFELLQFFKNEGFNLNTESIDIAKQVCYKRLSIYMNIGWQQKKREIDENDIIEETFFFYPLVGMLKDLTDAICDKNSNQ
ncbi:MAG: hypothetical protein PHI32_05370 [Dysgonamonadaceae bacterium]|nr:hypothetical protein [Dysgonamonadaceae bacterium]MDD4729663.1 hypothetical protein [Dysgonamonadaceae bacterium]